MPSEPLLSAAQRTFLASARRAVLATIAPDGRPRLVPICFVVAGEPPILYTPIDDKPKRGDDPLSLARVRDIQADPRVTILVDRWAEDWTRLAWLRTAGRATLLEPGAADDEHSLAVAALRSKYRQYEAHRLETRPILGVAIDYVVGWGAPDPSE
jgi:coenzyme F420-0:L-glutamate ligase/coenzyme F420-1:gamma-L-glutamate ligase